MRTGERKRSQAGRAGSRLRRADVQGWSVMYNQFLKKMPSQLWGHDPDRDNFHNLVKQVTPDYGIKLPAHQVKATWLGHASFLVEMPIQEGADRGVRVLFDPAYSERCSPLSFIGNIRYSGESSAYLVPWSSNMGSC